MSLPEDLKKEFPELEQPESLWETLERDLNELLAQHSSAKRTNVQTGFLKKVIKGSPSSANQMRLENSGSRIASLSGLKEAPKLVDELSGNPMNSKARLDLVEMVIRKTDGKDALVNRDTFLLAMLEVRGIPLDERRMRLALSAQNRYLNGLKNLFRQELVGDESGDETQNSKTDSDGSSSSNAVEQYDRQQKIKQGVRFLDELMKQFRVSVPADLQPLMLENVKAGGNSKAVMKLLNPYLNAISALPLARDVRKELLDILRRFSDKDPHASYAECLLFRKRATMLLSAIRAGNQAQEGAIENLLNEALQAISRSVQKIKKVPHEERPMMIREYAVVGQLLFHSLAMIKKIMSPEQFSHFEKATEMLPEIYQEKGVPELLGKMKKIISDIRGVQTPEDAKAEVEIEEKPVQEETASSPQESGNDDNPRRRNIFEKELPPEEELYSKKKQQKPKENIFQKPV